MTIAAALRTTTLFSVAMGGLVATLADGPLDIVGDVHGEIDALRDLLAHLGYVDGVHPSGRRLVFVGDLCDRGPDSIGVIELVQGFVERGLAQCVAGNHELNVLRKDAKHGNRWLLDPTHHESTVEYASRTASPAHQATIPAFFATLPLALERGDLRIVHASWSNDAAAVLRASPSSSIHAFQLYEGLMKRALEKNGMVQAAKDALTPHMAGLHDRSYAMPNLTPVGACEEARQMLNPVRVLTSGPERATPRQFFSTGKWRFCDRVTWWAEYTDDTPVVFGHYWRGLREEDPDKPDLFDGVATGDWLGPKRNAYCIDFSVGRRFKERKQGRRPPYQTRLGALRWPERTVTFDDGETISTA